MERSGFFNAVRDSQGNWDREYKAEDFAEFFNSFITNGVFPSPATNCQVTADGTGMYIMIKAGKAWINGYCYYLDEDLTLNVDVADGVLNRIDRIVLKMDTGSRAINAIVKKGTFATSPVASTLERDADGYEIALADVYVGAGVTSIRQADITDLRLDTALCGVVNSLIQADTTAIFDQYQDWFNGQKTGYEKSMQNEFNSWFSNIRDLLSTDQAGSLQNELGTYVTTNNGNDYSVTIPKIAALSENIPICVKFNAASTGATTLNINSLGAKSIVDYFGNAVTNIRTNLIANLRYESSADSFILQGKGGGGNATAADIQLGKTATTNLGFITGTSTKKYGIGDTVEFSNTLEKTAIIKCLNISASTETLFRILNEDNTYIYCQWSSTSVLIYNKILDSEITISVGSSLVNALYGDNNGYFYILTTTSVIKYSSTTGNIIWTYNLAHTVINNAVIKSDDSNNVYTIYNDGSHGRRVVVSSNGTLISDTPITPGCEHLLVYNNLVYFISMGVAYCYDIFVGNQISTTSLSGVLFTAIDYINQIYYTTDNVNVKAYNFSKTLLWTYAHGEPQSPSLTVMRTGLYLKNYDYKDVKLNLQGTVAYKNYQPTYAEIVYPVYNYDLDLFSALYYSYTESSNYTLCRILEKITIGG